MTINENQRESIRTQDSGLRTQDSGLRTQVIEIYAGGYWTSSPNPWHAMRINEKSMRINDNYNENQ